MSLWKDAKRGDWCYSFQFRGKGYAGRGFKTKREASSGREARRKAVKIKPTTPAAMGFKEAANLYLDYAVRKFADNTYNYKVLVYSRFLAYHGDLPIAEITPQQVHVFLDSRKSNNNYNVHKRELAALFNYAKRRLKVLAVNPCEDVDPMPHSAALKRIPNEEEVMRMIMAADPTNGERDLLIVLLQTLARVDEIFRLRWQDVNFEKRSVTLWTRKRKDGAYEPDALPMNQDLYDVLWRRWKARVQDEFVFWDVRANEGKGGRIIRLQYFMKNICRRAGIAPVGKGRREKKRKKGQYQDVDVYFGFHALRHFMASFLIDRMKESKKTVSELLRHRSLATTEIYLHSIGESQRAAMDKIAGIFANPQPEPATIPEVNSGMSL